jgi:hypothetical protein
MQHPQAPDLTDDEQRLAVARCPDELRHLFAGWLHGTHQLDGEHIHCDRAER